MKSKKMLRPHHKLDVWKRSINLVKRIYELTTPFPAEEKFGLVSLMRRAAVSIPSNIAEGAARNNHGQFINALYTAQANAAELETQLIISQRLGLVDVEICVELLEEINRISKLITGLQGSLG